MRTTHLIIHPMFLNPQRHAFVLQRKAKVKRWWWSSPITALVFLDSRLLQF